MKMNNKDMVVLPREWLEGLVERKRNVPGDVRDVDCLSRINHLFGYIESAENLLKLKQP